MKRLTTAIILSLTLCTVATQAQGLAYKIFHPDAIGGGFVASHFDRSHYLAYGTSTSAGPGLEVFALYNLKYPGLFITAGTGLYSLTDGLFSADSSSRTLFPTAEIKLGYKILKNQKFSPIVFGGLQAYYHQTKKTTVIAPAEYKGFDFGAFIGGGFQFTISPKLSAFVTGDYRYIFSDADQPKSKYWMAKAGVSYNLAPKSRRRDTMEYPMDDSDLALQALFQDTDNDQSASDNENYKPTEEDALALLFQEESGSDVESNTDPLDALFRTSTEDVSNEPTAIDATTDVGRLLAKINDLRTEMQQKDTELDDLRNKVAANERAIVNVSRGVAGQVAGYTDDALAVLDMQNFKSTYQLALQKHYNKDYQSAIQVFNALSASRPDHRLASNCQYWIGESYNAMGQHANAIEAFNKVLNYRSSYKLDDALLMTGIVYMKIGNQTSARENFQRLVSMFPDSEYAPKAMRYLGRL
ncbi:tetratricopeptide repeat protein [bacterium]|nr:tetratricopeptide repeat protein [bacterium]